MCLLCLLCLDVLNPTLPPGRARLATKPCATGSLTTTNTIGTANGSTALRALQQATRTQDRAWFQSQQFRGGGPCHFGRAAGPIRVDVQIATARPAQLLEFLPERCEAG